MYVVTSGRMQTGITCIGWGRGREHGVSTSTARCYREGFWQVDIGPLLPFVVAMRYVRLRYCEPAIAGSLETTAKVKMSKINQRLSLCPFGHLVSLRYDGILAS